MCRSSILITILMFLIIQKSYSYSKVEDLINHLKQESNYLKDDHVTCRTSSDCLEGFFCKNSDCIAKKAEGNLCLSGNEECACGKCVLDTLTWNKVCLSDSLDGECQDGGYNAFNFCKHNKDCPKGYFCDQNDGKVCISKLGAGRLCYDDSMCLCGKCEQVSHYSRPNKPAIKLNACSSC